MFLSLVLLLGETRAVTSGNSSPPPTAPSGLQVCDWRSIRSAHQEAQHRIIEHGECCHTARNSGQQWNTLFDGRGFLVEPDAVNWKWGLELTSYGFPGSGRAIAGKPIVGVEGQRLEYVWDKGALKEWFINDQRGLEHGFIVLQRPEVSSASRNDYLAFNMRTRGGLRPSIASDAKGVHFKDEAGATVIYYAGLKVWDADGKILTARFESAGVGSVRLLVDEHGARYPVTIDPVAQQAYLKAGNTGDDDRFGSAVSISRDTVVVGSPYEDSSTAGVNGTANDDAEDSGAAYVFVRTANGWSQQAYLKAGNPGFRDLFGTSVAISGDTIVVGSALEDSSTNEVNSPPNDDSDGAGAAYVFVRSAGVWTQQAYIKGSHTDSGDIFGRSIAVCGDTMIVGATGDDSSTAGVNSTPNDTPDRHGAAYVFVRSGGNWTQEAYFKSSNPDVGDQFGISVAISADTALVGANSEDSSTSGVNGIPNEDADRSGAAYVFVRNAGTWTQQAFLKAGNTGESDGFGEAIALSGDTAVIGAKSEDSSTTLINGIPDDAASSSGAAYVFVRDTGDWTQQAFLKANNTESGDSFGGSVAISGDTVIIGATGENSITKGVNSLRDNHGGNENPAASSGAAYVFTRSASNWTQLAYLKSSNSQINDSFGFAVAASDDTVIVGATGEDSITTGVNSIPDDIENSPGDSGAAYVFTLASSDKAPSLQVVREGSFTVLSYERPKDPANTPPSVQHSPDLAQGFAVLPTTEYALTVTDNAPDESETVTIRILDDVSIRRFFKVITEP